MVLGHLTVTAAGHRLLRERSQAVARLSLAWLIAGAYLPDLVDKPLNNLAGLSGHGYAHSLVVQAIVLPLVWLLLPRHRTQVAALAAGAGVHVIEDAVPLRTLLAPLLGAIPQAPHWGFVETFFEFYRRGGPLVWIEAAALVYWAAVARRSLWPARRTAAEG